MKNICPNINDPSWIALEKAVGRFEAMKDFMEYDGEIRSPEEVLAKLSGQPEVNYQLKAVNILQSDKAKQVFEKGKKNNWSLDKILSELQIPKEQKDLILSLGKTKLDDIITDLLANYSYAIEINIAKENKETPYTLYKKIGEKYVVFNVSDEQLDSFDNKEDAIKKVKEYNYLNTQHYSNLTVNEDFYKNNPDWEYKEQRITTPLITPSIKGHAQFAEDNDIGWFRAWYNKKTGEVHVLEVQSDLFQKGRDKSDLVSKIDESKLPGFSGTTSLEEYLDGFRYNMIEYGGKTEQEADIVIETERKKLSESDTSENQFLQLLNKDNNWVTFFIKSIIQDTAKQTITEVQQEDVEAKVRELEKDGLLEIDCKGKLKAEKGLATSFVKGRKWKVIKDLKGYPTHKEGGVDLTIGKDGVNIKNGNTQFTAKHGLVIPKN